VLETIAPGQCKTLTDEEFGQLKYKGKCPTNVADKIQLHDSAVGSIGRLEGAELEFKDGQHMITEVVTT